MDVPFPLLHKGPQRLKATVNTATTRRDPDIASKGIVLVAKEAMRSQTPMLKLDKVIHDKVFDRAGRELITGTN